MATLTGSPFNDQLFGGPADDVLSGLGGDDLLDGANGADTLTGGIGFYDELFGGNGDDVLSDEDGVSAIDGGAGNDRITLSVTNGWRNGAGETGPTVTGPQVVGGTGDDTISVAPSHPNFVFEIAADAAGGLGTSGGNDFVTIAGVYDRVIVLLGGGENTLQGGDGREQAQGGDGRDVMAGSAGNDTIDGGGNDDLVCGGTGEDSVIGGAGFADSIHGGRGNDVLADADGVSVMDGGFGDDTLRLEIAAGWDNDDFPGTAPLARGITGGAGADWIKVTASNENLSIRITGDGETAGIDDGNDTINLFDGAYGASTALLGAGEDDFTGGQGADFVLGGNDFDVVLGNGNADTLDGGAGGDFLSGGSGNDLLIGQDGNDSLWGDRPFDEFPQQLIEGNDTLLGGAGNDELVGGGGNDLLDGGSGDDVLWSIGGEDHLLGRLGNDMLYAGDGASTLEGGAGFDTYYVGRGDGPTLILDDTADGGNGLVLYWGSGPGPDRGADPDDVQILDNGDGTWSAFFADGGGATFRPEAVPLLNFYDAGPDQVGGTADDRVISYTWDGASYV